MFVRSILAFSLGCFPCLAVAQDIAHGRRLAQENCSPCHAVGLFGESPMPPAPAFRELSQRYPIDTLWEAMAEGIVTGHPEMPEFIWPPGEIDDILSYIASIQSPPERAAPKGDRLGSTPD